MGAALQSLRDGGGNSLEGYGTHHGIQGKNILGSHTTYFGMNGGRAKDGGDQSGLGKSEYVGIHSVCVCVCVMGGMCAGQFVAQ